MRPRTPIEAISTMIYQAYNYGDRDQIKMAIAEFKNARDLYIEQGMNPDEYDNKLKAYNESLDRTKD